MKSTRELWLILRARDEASGTLRRAARGFGGLQDTSVLQRQRAQVLTQIATSQRLRDQARDRQKSLEIGTKAIRQEIDEAKFLVNRERLLNQVNTLEKEGLGILQAEKRAAAELNQIEAQRAAIAGKRRRPRGAFRQFTAEQLDLRATAAQAALAAAGPAYASNAERLKINAMETENLALKERFLTERLNENTVAFERNGQVAAEQAARIRTLGARSRELLGAMKEVPLQNWQQMNQAVRDVGRSLTFMGAVGTIALGVMASKAAEFSKQLTLATTQARQPGQGAQAVTKIHGELLDTVLKQMQKFPATSQEMADSLYQIFSSTSVTRISDASNMLETFNKMAVAGGTSLETMTDAGISLFNNFGTEFPNMTEAANRFFAAVKVGRMNADQFAGSLAYILPIAKEAGLTFEDVGGAMAFLTRQTGAARTKQDAQGLARLIQLLGRTDVATGLAAKGVQVFGEGGKGHMRPILDIMQDVHDKIHLTDQEMLNFFKTISAAGGKGGTQGTIQAIRIFAQYQASIRSATSVQRQFTRDQNEMVKSFNEMSKDPGVRFEVFKNQMRALALMIGTELIPLFATFGAYIARLGQWFSGLSPHTKKLIAEFLFFGSIITLLGGILLTFAAAIGTVALIFVRVGTALKTGELGMKLFRSEAGFTTAGFVKFNGTLLVMVGLITAVHKATGSWIETLKIVSSVFGLIFGLRTIAKIVALTGRVEKLAVSLRALTAGPWSILIVATFIGASLIADKIKKLQEQYLNAESRTVDLTTQPQQRFINTLGQEIIKMKAAGVGAADILKQLDDRLGGGLQAKDLETAAFIRARELAKSRAQRLEEKMSGTAVKGPGSIPTFFTDAEFLKEMKLIVKLRQAIETAPNYRAIINATKAARREETRAARAETNMQKMMQEDIIQRIIQGQTKVSAVTSVNARKIATEYFRVQKQFDLAPTPALSRQLEKLKTQFEQLTPAQQAYFTAINANLGINQNVAQNAFNKLRQLQAQMKIAPSMAISKEIQKYQKILEQASPAQQAFFEALKEKLGDVKVITDKQALSMAQQAANLKKAFDAHPSAAGWQNWYRVQKNFTTLATSDQQQFADDMVAANKAATDKMKQDYDTLLNSLQSKFDSIRSSLESAFGTISSGPVSTKLNQQVENIRNAGTTQANALRDQAKKIQDAFEESTNVDSQTGTLIDLGLIDNPADKKASVDKQVKALNDQADAIDKAAGITADKLQKRLAEHRLTPAEILGDLKGQVKAFQSWNNDLDAIAKRGGPAALVDQLRNLGPEFDNILKGIRKMSPEQFREYVATFNKGQKALDNQAMKQLKSQLKMYREHGGNIAKAIAKGIEDESPALRNALVKLMEQAFPGLKVPETDKVAKGGGRNVPAPKRAPVVRQPRVLQRPTNARTTQGVHHTVHYHYHAGEKGMSPQTYFQKMHFRQRNQRRC